ncbi:MAG: hypothetical protein HY331_18530 [Chloroflexi bacterium]|nr:hypothetical protein [Chloroflexota bacterium]
MIPFSRSMRSLSGDRVFPALATLAIAMLLLVGWGIWFATARMTLYETSRVFHLNRDGSVTATFPAEALARIRPGQVAALHLDQAGKDQAEPLRATVMDVDSRPGNAQGQVRIYVYAPGALRSGTTGQVRIEVQYVSPLMLAMQSAGQRIGGSQPAGGRQGPGQARQPGQ